MTPLSLGRETLTLFTGRLANLILSMAGLALYPALLGPQAHGILQNYFGLFLLLLGFLNGCAAPMMAHFVAIYRVSDPPRQGVLAAQVFRWFAVVLFSLWILYPFLQDRTGFGWIFLGVACSGAAQLLAAAEYGLGRLGPSTWFPVLILFLRLVLICGAAWWVRRGTSVLNLEDWAIRAIPPLLLLCSIPSLLWTSASCHKRRAMFFVSGAPTTTQSLSLFPWTEIRALGIAAMVGQLIYQSATRSLVPLSHQLGFSKEQVGYFGLAMQGFGLVVYLAGIFSVSAYPWLVSAQEAGEGDRFRRIQGEAWRMSGLLGGWVVTGMVGMAHPLVWIVLGEEYRPDIDLIVHLIQVSALAGAFMLAAEFHLRMLLCLTAMTRYLIALVAGFAISVPYLVWVILAGRGIAEFSWTLPLGVGGLMVLSLALSPKTEGFYRVSGAALLSGGIALLAGVPFAGETYLSLFIEGTVLSVTYGACAWLLGLARREDLARVFRAGRPRVDEVPPT
ncbi:MAG: hypothetical protein HUU16_15245 [Candidatus Omnitrophica bacterium]|nr:hypothetical protein [bacterium]NUN97517.1 hypothetical protein [Candidatus Omnitrophota bacterium]